ncbi:MAG: hypothetical protein RMJ98_02025 [Myxococcales bacterium]|nr:hypothetical protein [Polyangiaceae bacterium]MDW8248066.1 hypothetical protein [Myxococcales bacterium]
MRRSYLRGLLHLGLSVACLLGTRGAAAKERYLASNPTTQGQLVFVGFKNNTTIAIKDLATNFTQGFTVNQGQRLAPIPAPLGRFVVETSEPLFALLGFDCCSFSGSFFYPTLDGRKFY